MRIFGHPVHPAIVHFPIACWVLAAGADVVALFISEDPFWPRAAIWLQAIGLALAVPAAIAGFLDLGQLKENKRATGAATTHASLMVIAMGLTAASLAGKTAPLMSAETQWPYIASIAAGAMVIIGAFFGGELVYKYNMGRRHTHAKESEEKTL